MNDKLNGITVHPGIITSYSSTKFRSKIIKAGLAKAFHALTGQPSNETPTHNGLVVEHEGELFVGDSVAPKSKLTPFSDYEERLTSGGIINLQLFEVVECSLTRQRWAADWWVKNVLPTAYDQPAYIRLTLKAIFGLNLPWSGGMSSRFYCTEGIEDAFFLGAYYDIFPGENTPTTYSTIKAWKLCRLRLLTT
jgi:hypothetical protein